MHHSYVLSEQAKDMLKESGLQSKIDNVASAAFYSNDEALYLRGYIDPTWVQDEALDLSRKKAYAVLDLSDEERRLFNNTVDCPDWSKWRFGYGKFVPYTALDGLLASGFYASKVLDNDFSQLHGFNHVSDLFFASGISFLQQWSEKKRDGRAYYWKNKYGELNFPGGPFGDFYLGFTSKEVPTVRNHMMQTSNLYAPNIVGVTKVGLYEDHHAEPYFLGVLLRYIKHYNIPSDIAQNPVEFMKSFDEQEQQVGSYSDYGFDNYLYVNNIKMEYNYPFHSSDTFGKNNSERLITVNKENELVFARELLPEIIITPQDIDQAITGLYHVTHNGLTRSSVYSLNEVMKALLEVSTN